MQIELTYSDLKAIIEALRYDYRSRGDENDPEILDLIELEFRLGGYILDAYQESKWKPLTEAEIKKLEQGYIGKSLWRLQNKPESDDKSG